VTVSIKPLFTVSLEPSFEYGGRTPAAGAKASVSGCSKVPRRIPIRQKHGLSAGVPVMRSPRLMTQRDRARSNFQTFAHLSRLQDFQQLSKFGHP
jgi:hypothetical protein